MLDRKNSIQPAPGKGQDTDGRSSTFLAFVTAECSCRPAYCSLLTELWSLISAIVGKGILTISPFEHSIFTLGVVSA